MDEWCWAESASGGLNALLPAMAQLMPQVGCAHGAVDVRDVGRLNAFALELVLPLVITDLVRDLRFGCCWSFHIFCSEFNSFRSNKIKRLQLF